MTFKRFRRRINCFCSYSFIIWCFGFITSFFMFLIFLYSIDFFNLLRLA